MYKFDWDHETGGVILKPDQAKMSLEIRPVFWDEMEIQNFGRLFEYEKSDMPFMWYDGKNYIYRGEILLRYKAPKDICSESEIDYIDESLKGKKLYPIDMAATLRKNRDLMDSLVQESMIGIYDAYMKYKDEMDIIYVSFSGGKDSQVTLDLVKRTLPAGSFHVVWLDSGMELSFTRAAAEKEQKECEKQGIPFHVVSSKFDAMELWKQIGPPARSLRWCCSLLQSVPGMKFLRSFTGKNDLRSLGFMGNRAYESRMRSKYSMIEPNKHKGQINCQPIVNYSSLEVFLYLFDRQLTINTGYIKGMKRIGCIICPMAGIQGIRSYLEIYPEEVKPWLELIEGMYSDEQVGKHAMISDDWKHRSSCDGMKLETNHREYMVGSSLHIEFSKPTTEWKEWIKTIGTLQKEDDNSFSIDYRGQKIVFVCAENQDDYHVVLENADSYRESGFLDYFKNVFRKAASCILCYCCEVDCPHGQLSMEGNVLRVKEGCIHCMSCHKVNLGCSVYASRHKVQELLL